MSDQRRRNLIAFAHREGYNCWASTERALIAHRNSFQLYRATATQNCRAVFRKPSLRCLVNWYFNTRGLQIAHRRYVSNNSRVRNPSVTAQSHNEVSIPRILTYIVRGNKNAATRGTVATALTYRTMLPLHYGGSSPILASPRLKPVLDSPHLLYSSISFPS